MKDMSLPREELYVVGHVRPVHMRVPLKNDSLLSCRGHAQTSYAGNSLRLICWPERRLAPTEIVVDSRDCLLKMELCGTPLRVSGGIVDVMRRQRPILLLKIRDYVYLDQKRQSFRAPVQVPVLCWPVNENNEAVNPKTVARSINISGGGILVWSKSNWTEGQMLRLEFDLGNNLSPLRCTARVLRSEMDVTYGMTAMQWEDISEAQRDRIVSLCFDKQREEIRRLKKGAQG